MFIIGWIYKFLYGSEAWEELNRPPKNRRK